MWPRSLVFFALLLWFATTWGVYWRLTVFGVIFCTATMAFSPFSVVVAFMVSFCIMFMLAFFVTLGFPFSFAWFMVAFVLAFSTGLGFVTLFCLWSA